MLVGIVNFYKSKTDYINNLCDALKFIGYNIVVINYKDDWFNIIKSSHIRKWFLSGSSFSVLDNKSPQIRKEILYLTSKRFFLVCYSMESFLFNMGCNLIKRKKYISESIILNMNNNKLDVFRNHQYYIEPESLKPGMKLIAIYNDETMTVKYKNIMMTQWHPENSIDGIKILNHWLSLKNKQH